MRVSNAKSDTFVLHGNTPNPWGNETGINFYLPESGNVSVKVKDITGRQVYMHQDYFNKGENTIRLTKDQIGVTGILIYEISFGKEVKTMKMLNIK